LFLPLKLELGEVWRLVFQRGLLPWIPHIELAVGLLDGFDLILIVRILGGIDSLNFERGVRLEWTKRCIGPSWTNVSNPLN
jgi:hypothetical protein